MICGMSITALRTNQLFEFIKGMTIKPDIWVIYIDNNPKKDLDIKNRYMRITNNYNLVKKVVPDCSDYVFILEDDCTPPVDIVERLYNTMSKDESVDCVTTACYQRMLGNNDHLEDDLMVYNIEIRKPYMMIHHHTDRSGLKKVDATSFNCMMFKKKVLDTTNFMGDSYFMTHDMNFFLQCKLLKYNVLCDYSIPTKHNNAKDWNGV